MPFQQIRFRQTGGFAGLVRGCDLDARSLPDSARADLNRLLERSHVADRPPRAAVSATEDQARDLVRYDLDITLSSGTTRVSLDDRDLAGDVAALVTYLLKCSRPMTLDE